MAPPRGGGGGSGRVAGQKPVLRWGRPPAGAWTPPRSGRPGARGGEDAASRAYPRSMTVATLQDEALALLRELAGPDAEFRGHQLEAIADLVEERRRVLCVQRTGWGKSAVYFIATALLRRGGAGPTVLISPLLALMRNQIAAAQRLGLRAVTVNSTNRDDWDAVAGQLDRDEVDLRPLRPGPPQHPP